MEKTPLTELVKIFLTEDQLRIIGEIALRDSEIEQLNNEIADLEESLNARSIDGAKPKISRMELIDKIDTIIKESYCASSREEAELYIIHKIADLWE